MDYELFFLIISAKQDQFENMLPVKSCLILTYHCVKMASVSFKTAPTVTSKLAPLALARITITSCVSCYRPVYLLLRSTVVRKADRQQNLTPSFDWKHLKVAKTEFKVVKNILLVSALKKKFLSILTNIALSDLV